MSIYFPYNGKAQITKFLTVYKSLDVSDSYRTLITNFYTALSTGKRVAIKAEELETTIESDKEVTLQLSDEELSNYSYTLYTVFKKDKDHPNYYQLVYDSDDVKLEGNNITTKIGNNLIKMVDENGQDYLPVTYRKGDGIGTYQMVGIFTDRTRDFTDKKYSQVAKAEFTMDNGKATITAASVTSSDDERLLGVYLDLNKYNFFTFICSRYKLFDANGNMLDTWEASPTKVGYEDEIKNFNFTNTGIMDDGEYYVLFKIFDINNDSHTSKLIKIG